VYGLGADIFNAEAIGKIFDAKGRPSDNPLIVHIGSESQIAQLASEQSESAKRLIDSFFPGPLTIVLKKSPRISDLASAGLKTIAIRMPRHEIASKFLELCATPVVAPSANISGRPSPTTWRAVLEDLDGKIDCILQGEPTQIGLESTVVDCSSDPPSLLRSGAISFEELRKIVPEIILDESKDSIAPRSPGLKHRHYSPRAKVVLVTSSSEALASPENAYIGFGIASGKFGARKIVATVDEYARELFEFFRDCDRKNMKKIFCERVEETGIGRALMDRLKRAAR